MSKEKKNSTPMSLRMDTVIYERLQSYCKESGLSKTVAIERAVNQYIDDYEKQLSKLKSID